MRITANWVHQIQAGSASPSTFAVHLEEYVRPLGCSEFPGGTVFQEESWQSDSRFIIGREVVITSYMIYLTDV